MFWNQTTQNLNKYSKQRKEKISVFGFSIDFDWFVIVAVTFALLFGVFFYANNKIKTIDTYTPESTQEELFLSEDKRVNSKADKILQKFKERKENSFEEGVLKVGETIDQ